MEKVRANLRASLPPGAALTRARNHSLAVVQGRLSHRRSKHDQQVMDLNSVDDVDEAASGHELALSDDEE